MKAQILSVMVGIMMVSAISCNNKSVEDIDVIDLKEYFEYLDFPVDSILRAGTRFVSAGDFLIMEDLLSDYTMLFYNMDSKEVKRFARRGRGPSERLGLISLDVTNGKDIIAHDLSGRYTVYDMESGYPVLYKEFPSNGEHWRRELPGNIAVVFPMEPYLDRSRYEVRCNDSIISCFGEPGKRLSATQSNFILPELETLDNDGTRIALFSVSGMYYKIFDLSDLSDPSLIVEKVYSMPEYIPSVKNDGSYSLSMNNIMGFSSPVSSIGRIYTPFSGRSITDMLRSGVTGDIGTKIFSVTWDGEREVFITLGGTQILSVAYNGERGVLYVLGVEEDGSYSVRYCSTSVIESVL